MTMLAAPAFPLTSSLFIPKLGERQQSPAMVTDVAWHGKWWWFASLECPSG